MILLKYKAPVRQANSPNPADEFSALESDNWSTEKISADPVNEYPTIFYQKNCADLKPAEILMNLILPVVSNRLQDHQEARKLKHLLKEVTLK